jgi:hypothetical protein
LLLGFERELGQVLEAELWKKLNFGSVRLTDRIHHILRFGHRRAAKSS